MKTLLTIFIILMTGCVSLPRDSLQLPITYGTLKVIERDNNISSGDVIDAVNKMEEFVESDKTLSGSVVREYVTSLEEWQSLGSGDKFLIISIFTSVEETLQSRIDEGSVKTKVGVYLNYVRTAASY